VSGKGAFKSGVLSWLFCLAAAAGWAQTPPPPSPPPQVSQPFSGFVSSYEILRTIRAAGFDPLAPPLREGTDYVMRATDYRGILMRVVVDARTGAIRDVTRIVPGPGRYGQFFGMPPYDPADYDAAMNAPGGDGVEPPSGRPPAATRPAAHPVVALPPPLPRPRPATLASRKSDGETNPAAKVQPMPIPTSETPKTETAKTETPKSGPIAGTGAAVVAKPAGAPEAKPEINSEVVTVPPSPAPAAPKRPPPVVPPLND
jgi:hypothetical protein